MPSYRGGEEEKENVVNGNETGGEKTGGRLKRRKSRKSRKPRKSRKQRKSYRRR